MKKKKIVILSASIAVVLIVAIITSILLWPTGENPSSSGKKQQIVVIKKRPVKQDTDTEEQDKSEDVSDEFSNEDFLYDGSDVDASDPVYEVDIEPYTVLPSDKKIGYLMYHHHPGMWDEKFADVYGEEKSFTNYCRVSSIEQAKQVKAAGGMCWIYVTAPYASGSASLEFKYDYEGNLKSQMQAYKDAGVWDAIAGFETEEMTTGISHEQFKKFTKFLRDSYPEKRILACTSPWEIEGATVFGKVIEPMNYEAFAYVTDIGFDMYHTDDYAEHERLLRVMKERLGRKDVRIWFFPCTYKYWQSTSEDYMIKSLDIAYDLLMKEENPGGIYMYTWETYGTDYGLRDLLDPDGNFKYTRLANRIVAIGKEILASDYVYNKPLN